MIVAAIDPTLPWSPPIDGRELSLAAASFICASRRAISLPLSVFAFWSGFAF